MASSNTPIYDCTPPTSITITPNASPSHRLQNPTYHIPLTFRKPLEIAAEHLQAGQTVAFPTETVYGLGANSLDPSAVLKIYRIKNRPSDNPLIIHVSSLDMLHRLLPPGYQLSALYLALIDEFWPGPLTLLFPSPAPPPLPAPQTNGIRMPSHPLALALIHTANLPLSAPSANSSGRPSPTKAIHVYNDLNGSEGLGCILDGGDCGVGVESTVVDGLGWKIDGGGVVDILRPGGLGVEEIERIVRKVDQAGKETEILVHGKPWQRNSNLVASSATSKQPSALCNGAKVTATAALPPSTPGMKYRHYSPRIPVYLLLPSTIFPSPTASSSSSVAFTNGGAKEVTPSSDYSPSAVLRTILDQIGSSTSTSKRATSKPKIGLLHYENSPLSRRMLDDALLDSSGRMDIVSVSLGPTSETAAQRLFSGILSLEGDISLANGDLTANGGSASASPPPAPLSPSGVDAILIEGCSDEGLGLAVMERVGKAVGGGGKNGELGNGQGSGEHGRYWVQL